MIGLALGFLRGIPWQAWAALVVAIALWQIHSHGYRAGVADERAEGDARIAALYAQIEGDRTRAEREARNRESAHRAELDAIAAQHAKELQDAQATADAVAADLRAGTVRLRDHWRGCENAKARVPATPATPAGADAGAELRSAGASNLVRLGAECDARIRGLQRVIGANNAAL